MSWIEEIEVEESEDELQDIFEDLIEKRGKVSNILKVHSLNPEAMRSHLDLYMSVMFKSTSLSRKESEMIAVVVSRANGCEYCIAHHSEALKHYIGKEKVLKLAENYGEMDIEEKHQKMLEFCEKLTLEPHKIKEEDLEVLRDAGFDDDDLLNIVLITGYFNFVNRIALGLGVEHDTEEIEGYDY